MAVDAGVNPAPHAVGYVTPTDRSSADSMPIPAEDQRKHPRFVLSLAITLQGENNFYTGLSENISEAGVFIATQQMLAIGTPVVLSFTLPNALDPISVLGTVQWVRGPDAMAKAENNFGAHFSEVKPGMGVQFSDVDQQSIRTIREFMQFRDPEFFD